MGTKDDNFTAADDDGPEVNDQVVSKRKSSIKKKKSKAPKGGCCTRVFRKIFAKMYPAEKKTLYTTQGKWLRTMAGFFMFADFCFFVFALALVGFQAMMMDLWLGLWGYSVWLTLREWVTIMYLFFKCMAAFMLLFNSNSGSSYSGTMASTQIFGLILNACFHILSVYYVGRAYYQFRKNGGIHGLKPAGKLPEE